MSLLVSMLPVYLLGNIHCFGMCGPLVMTLSHHRYRLFYFLGRLFSFTLAGFFSGSLGFVLQIFLSAYAVGAILSLVFGAILCGVGLSYFFSFKGVRWPWMHKKLASMNKTLSFLMLKDRPFPTFLFGFFTLFLPCGQTLLVFSACALAGVGSVGALNGFVFALLTTPSLFLAMKLSSLFKRYKQLSEQVIGGTALLIGGLAWLRGCAEIGLLPHFTLSERLHLVLW